MEKKDKVLTVVVPTYNMEKYLRRCLDSLIVSDEQMQMLEVLVINDGSKDTSSQIAHEYQDRYPQTFRVIDKENGNYGSCVNRGLKEATGKYIKILDADDWYDNANFKKYLDTIKDLDVDLVLNDMQFVNPEGKKLRANKLPFPHCEEFQFFPTREKPGMHEIAYKTKNVRSIDYHQTEGISYTDQQWIFAPMCKVRSAYYIPEIVYMYLYGREGQTMCRAERYKTLNHRLILIKGMLELYHKQQYEGDVAEWMKEKLLQTLSGSYRLILLELMDDKNEYLIELDNYIKENDPTIYKELVECYVSDKLKYKFIKYWRKHHKLPQKRIINIIKRIYLIAKGKSYIVSNM